MVTGSSSEIRHFLGLTLGSIGVAFGAIGTSPLYAFREAVIAAGSVSREAVFGVVSLILWALIVVVTCKYVLVLLRADDKGEGGTLTLMTLAIRGVGRRTLTLFIFAMIGVALFFGYALIMPAISMLSAIEGMNVVAPDNNYVVPLTALFLVFLCVIQSSGTTSVATWFGPIMVIWLVVIGLAGLRHLFAHLDVLTAFNPVHGLSFLLTNGTVGFLTLGTVVLAVAGAKRCTRALAIMAASRSRLPGSRLFSRCSP
jgi:KUP system potassium uptake protein